MSAPGTTRKAAPLYGAFLLARGRAEGMLLIAAPPEAELAVAARSFWAAVVCLPVFLGLHLLDWASGTMQPFPARGLALDMVGFATGWAGFALVTYWLAEVIGRGHLWPRFITAWNWCNVVQYLFLVGAAVPALTGLPWFFVQTAWLVAMGWALWLEWFATKLALDVPGGVAAVLVGLDFAMGLLLAGLLDAGG